MNEIKVIDLLNMISKGEEVPKKIKYREMIYHICYEYGDYESDIEEYRFADTKEHYYLFEDIDMLKCLNDEIEIIEEEKKIPEKLELPSFNEFKTMTPEARYVVTAKEYDVLNDIIDFLKSKGE